MRRRIIKGILIIGIIVFLLFHYNLLSKKGFVKSAKKMPEGVSLEEVTYYKNVMNNKYIVIYSNDSSSYIEQLSKTDLALLKDNMKIIDVKCNKGGNIVLIAGALSIIAIVFIKVRPKEED